MGPSALTGLKAEMAARTLARGELTWSGLVGCAGFPDLDAVFEIRVGFNVNTTEGGAGSQHIAHTANRCCDRKTGHGDGVKHRIASFGRQCVDDHFDGRVLVARGTGFNAGDFFGADGFDLISLALGLVAGVIKDASESWPPFHQLRSEPSRMIFGGHLPRFSRLLLGLQQPLFGVLLGGFDASEDLGHTHVEHLLNFPAKGGLRV